MKDGDAMNPLPECSGETPRRVTSTPTRAKIDLEPLAAKAGMSVLEALACADATGEPVDSILDDAERYRRRMASWRIPGASQKPPARLAKVLMGMDRPGVWRETDAARDVRRWLDSPSWAIVLGGGIGVGKTVGACLAIVLRRCGLFVRAEELASPDGGRELAARAKAEVGVLVIDDMGYEALTAISESRVCDVWSHRHAEGLRTIGTTNLNLRGVGGFAERYGERLVSRLFEGGGEFIGYEGPDLRRGNV